MYIIPSKGMKENLFRVDESVAKTNARVKYYYNKSGELYPVQMLVCEQAVFTDKMFEPDVDKEIVCSSDSDSDVVSSSGGGSYEAICRARKNLYDILRCNSFKWFVTLTFDRQKVDRESYDAVVKKMSQWCDNRVRRNGLIYCGVIERHKNSNGLHFHFCMNDVLNLEDSGTVKVPGKKKPILRATAKKQHIPESEWKTVYNITDWSYGFSTAVEVTGDDKGARVAGYLRKYLTKGVEKIGGRYYYSGGKLRRPVYKYVNAELSELDCDYEFKAGAFAYRGINLDKGAFENEEES